jgi:hypothetical protein
MSPTPDERERIRAGIHRLLNDQAEHSNGALTIVALAQEAQVPRNALTQRHTDLKNEPSLTCISSSGRAQVPSSSQRLNRS